MIVVVIDEDDKVAARSRDMKKADQIIIDNHLADVERVAQLLAVTLPADLPTDLESLPGASSSPQHAKTILDQAIDASHYIPTAPRVQSRNLEARWELAKMIDLNAVKRRCARGYESFSKVLLITTQSTLSALQSLPTPQNSD